MIKKIKSALISVFHKEGLDDIMPLLTKHKIKVFSTGGTQSLLEGYGVEVHRVEDLTSYPSILDGRVKTLHPKVFGGILARREVHHLSQLDEYDIPELDLVVVDLYPFEKTMATTKDEDEIIEKIDIGGISLIRAAAKNFNDVVVIPSQNEYAELKKILSEQDAQTDTLQRKKLAKAAYDVSSHYDTLIHNYFARDFDDHQSLKLSARPASELRYGENPHQKAQYFGDLDIEFNKLNGKDLSYNNLVDVDSAIDLMREFERDQVTFAILKHTNCCGVATRPTTAEAFTAALAGDPISAFGGILISNGTIDLKTAEEIDKQFYEVLIAPAFSEEALTFLSKKKARILLERKNVPAPKVKLKSLLSGYIAQDNDLLIESPDAFEVKTKKYPTTEQLEQLFFANKLVKHLKSNTIVLANNQQLLGMGCGQTSRVDACIQAIDKAKNMGFSLEGAVMASDAFFPFPDCVELAEKAGVKSVIQPGGSRNDQQSIDYCNDHGISMVFTGVRHFKH